MEALTTRLVDNLRSSIADLVAEVVSSADAAASRGAAGASGAAAAAGGASANDAASDAAAQKAEEDAKRAEALDVALKELKWCHKQVCDPSWEYLLLSMMLRWLDLYRVYKLVSSSTPRYFE